MYVLCKDGFPAESCHIELKDAVTDLKRAYSYYSRQERVVKMTDIINNTFGIECAGGEKHSFSIGEV